MNNEKLLYGRFMNCPKDWIDYFQAFAPIIIGACVAWVAYSQWRTAELKRKQDLFDKRYEVYRSVMKLIGSGMSYNKGENTEIDQLFRSHISDGRCYFLFGEEIEEYLRELYDKRLKRATCSNDIENTRRSGTPNKNFVKEDKELREYFEEQNKKVKRKFAKYLKIP